MKTVVLFGRAAISVYVMKRFFARNIEARGRMARGITALLLLLAAIGFVRYVRWLALGLAIVGMFVLFEAWRGWCVVRACGIKTKM